MLAYVQVDVLDPAVKISAPEDTMFPDGQADELSWLREEPVRRYVGLSRARAAGPGVGPRARAERRLPVRGRGRGRGRPRLRNMLESTPTHEDPIGDAWCTVRAVAGDRAGSPKSTAGPRVSCAAYAVNRLSSVESGLSRAMVGSRLCAARQITSSRGVLSAVI